MTPHQKTYCTQNDITDLDIRWVGLGGRLKDNPQASTNSLKLSDDETFHYGISMLQTYIEDLATTQVLSFKTLSHHFKVGVERQIAELSRGDVLPKSPSYHRC